MNITCPNCTTSYGIDAAAFGDSGRNVRCARCHEVWLAYPDAVATTPAFASSISADDGIDAPAEHPGTTISSGDDWQDDHTPVIDSPSIVHDGQSGQVEIGSATNWATTVQAEVIEEAVIAAPPRPRRRLPRLAWHRFPDLRISLPVAIAAMGALVFALIIWRKDVVRLLPQTATVFKVMGLGVNLRNLAFDNVRVRTETVDNKPVLVIEGAIVGTTPKPVEIPRLRFILRDTHGTEIYAWSAILEQSVLQPGDRATFRSRLAAPPPEAHDIAVRFFNRRDVVAGGS
jgi:predicted Zn finger-like uncharacterized protein